MDYEIDETEEEETVTVPANGLVYDGASDDTEVIVPDVVVDTEPSDEVAEDAADTAADVTETPGGETSDAADTVTGESAAEEETGLEEESEDQISEDGAVSDEEVSEDIVADSETAAEEDTEIEDEEQSDLAGGTTEEDSSQEETVTEDSEALQDEEEEEAEEVSEEAAEEEASDEETLTVGQIRITRHEAPIVAAPGDGEIIDEEILDEDEEIPDEEIVDEEIVDEEILDEDVLDDEEDGLADFFHYTGVVMSDGEDEEILNEMSIEPVSDPEELTEDDILALLGEKASDDSQIMTMEEATKSSLAKRMFSRAKKTQVIGYNLTASGGITVLSARTGEAISDVYEYAASLFATSSEAIYKILTSDIAVSQEGGDIKAGQSLTFSLSLTPRAVPTFGKEIGEAPAISITLFRMWPFV